jgi:alpha-tubulin suppressor-like RCC1 family protein
VGLTANVTQVEVGMALTCAVMAGGVHCWGRNDDGQLGASPVEFSTTPVPIAGLTTGVLSIAVGGIHVCARMVNTVKCWGDNLHGQLGRDDVESSNVPVEVQYPF